LGNPRQPKLRCIQAGNQSLGFGKYFGIMTTLLIQNGTVPVGKLITHRYVLDDIHDAFDAIRTKTGMKAIIYINEELKNPSK